MSLPRKFGLFQRPWSAHGLTYLRERLTSHNRNGLHAPEEIDRLARRVLVPTLPISDEELARTGHHDRGQRLARQDSWDDLSEAIRSADCARRTTPGGEPAALLLADGARSDVVAAAEDALHDLVTPDPEGLQAFGTIFVDRPRDYPAGLVVALAHIDIAAAWRRFSDLRDPHDSAAHIAFHLNEATGILNTFREEARNTPSITAALAILAAATSQPVQRLVDLNERLIMLEPGAHRHMRAYGRHLLRVPGGGPAAIEVAARRMAVQMEDYWGAGGYVWVYLDALAMDAATLDLIDSEFFITGLRDIFDRNEDQHIANVLAAFCAITMRPRPDVPTAPHAAAARTRIHDFVDDILRHHLSELHPLIWSQALLAPTAPRLLPARRALVSKGRQTALRVIAARLASDIPSHGAISLSGTGLKRLSTLDS
ncbi:MAG: hypothetical protein AAF965_02675 [Pseudomonadota bacterium]